MQTPTYPVMCPIPLCVALTIHNVTDGRDLTHVALHGSDAELYVFTGRQ